MSLGVWSRIRGAFSREFAALLNPGLAFPTEGGEFLLAEVHIQDGQTLESALRRFKRKVRQEDIVKEPADAPVDSAVRIRLAGGQIAARVLKRE